MFPNSALAIVVPGRPVVTQFDTSQPGLWTTDIVRPGEVSEICVQLLQPIAPAAATGSEMGVGVFFSIPNTPNWEFLGVLTNNRPSDIFSTGWPLRFETAQQPVLRIGMHWEVRASLEQKLTTKPPLNVKKELARKVALNLFRYIESFFNATDTIGIGLSEQEARRVTQTLTELLDKWYNRFEQRYALDPLFFIRCE